eukprot:1183581-Pleurochrysis_carterae.AAC.1
MAHAQDVTRGPPATSPAPVPCLKRTVSAAHSCRCRTTKTGSVNTPAYSNGSTATVVTCTHASEQRHEGQKA